MRGILADINVKGIIGHLAHIWLSATWRELWFELNISIESFESLGLRTDAPDSTIWRICQEQALILITANRNADGPHSLEMVMRGENQPDSLPVITLADARRISLVRQSSNEAPPEGLGSPIYQLDVGSQGADWSESGRQGSVLENW